MYLFADEVLLSGKHYRDLYLADLAASVPVKPQLDRMEKKIDSLLGNHPEVDTSHAETLRDPRWDEWLIL